MLYAAVLPHARQAASPASEKVCAPQVVHEEAVLVTVQAAAGAEPAAHVRQGAQVDAPAAVE